MTDIKDVCGTCHGDDYVDTAAGVYLCPDCAVSGSTYRELAAEIATMTDPFDEWLAALAFVKPGRDLTITRGGSSWYANIEHEKHYTVWYADGDSPVDALRRLTSALRQRGEPTYEHGGEWERPAHRFDWEKAMEKWRVTHGRHCPCSACARQDWTEPDLAPCGMHGPSCPAKYDPYPKARVSR